MANYRRSEIVSGLFVVAAVLIFVALSFRVGGVDLGAVLGRRGVACRLHLADVKTLDVGAKVAVAGRRVGTVTGLRLVERPLAERDVDRLRATLGPDAAALAAGMNRHVVAVDFALHDSDLRIDWDTARVVLAQDGFLGRHYLLLDPGYWPPDRAPPRLAERRPTGTPELALREAAGLEDLMASLRPVLTRVESILGKVDDGVLSGRNVERAGQAVETALAILADLRAILDDDNPRGLRAAILQPLSRLLASADEAVRDIRTRLLDQTLTRVEKLLDEAPALLESSRRVLARVEGMLDDSQPKIARIVDDLAGLSSSLDQRIGALQERVNALLDGGRAVITDNRAELAEVVRRVRRTMWEAEMAMRKIRSNPAYLLFGDDEPDLGARPVDASGALRAGRARAYGQRDESGDGR